MARLNPYYAALASKLYRKRHPAIVGQGCSVAFLFPTERGSVGDEAMAVAVASELRGRDCQRIGLVSFSPTDIWTDFPNIDESRNRPLGGAMDWVRFCKWLSGYDAFGTIGADVLDGYYSPTRSIERLRLAQVASVMGLRSVILGFSYRSTPEKTSLAYLKKLDKHVSIYCRDPNSVSRVRSLSGMPASQSADLAFLLPPDAVTTRVVRLNDWTREKKGAGGFVVGVNCNLQALGKTLQSRDSDLVNAHVTAFHDLGRQYVNLSFVLMPHDSRGLNSDVSMAKRIYGQLNAQMQARTYLVDCAWSASEIKAAAASFDAAITGRMHFAIACLGSETPVCAFEYQDKFSGLYNLFDLESLCMPGAESLEATSIYRAIESIYHDAGPLRSAIRERLPGVKNLAKRNVSALMGVPHAE